MVRKTLTRNKLNSEKGVTGVDIVVSVTMIVITIAVVMAIFVNISSTSREVNRTSGATRMVTNVLENIELMYYEDFLDYLGQLTHKTYNGSEHIYTAVDPAISDYNGTYLIPGEYFASEKFFDTKIPNGYTLKVVVSNVYGETEPSKFDLVRKVNVSVLFDVSGREKEISLSTTKTFERLNSLYNKSVNDINYFYSMKTDDVTKYNNNITAGKATIMYVAEENISGTIKYKTSTDLSATYSYGEYESDEIKPIMAIVNHNENIQAGSGYVKDSRKDQIYIWIPSHRIETTAGTEKIIYEYETYKIARIKVDKLNKVDGTSLPFITAKKGITVDGNSIGFKNATGESLTGVWVSVDKLKNCNSATSSAFEKSLYNFCKKFVDYELINGI